MAKSRTLKKYKVKKQTIKIEREFSVEVQQLPELISPTSRECTLFGQDFRLFMMSVFPLFFVFLGVVFGRTKVNRLVRPKNKIHPDILTP